MNKILLALLFSCTSFQQDNFPDHWWEQVDKSNAPSWEILPQNAKKNEVVLSKRNELGILSNFAKTPFRLDGVLYQGLEGFWQMMKYPENKEDSRFLKGIHWPVSREKVSQMTGFEAKRYGDTGSSNMKELKIDWVTYKGQKIKYWTNKRGKHFSLIKRAMIAKMNQNPKVKQILLSTKSLKLKADHHQDIKHPAWLYSKIWMEIRSELKK